MCCTHLLEVFHLDVREAGDVLLSFLERTVEEAL